MSDAIDRARDIIERYLPAMPDQQAAFVTRDAARALDEAGLLASPERDAAVAAKALRDAAADLGRRASDPALIESADRHSGYYAGVRAAMQREIQLLHDRADRIGGER